MNKFLVQVFGKKGCPKCKVLNKRLDKVLEKPEWEGFEKSYFDVTTVDGLVNFGKAECLNGQRIPSFLVCKIDDKGQTHKIRQTFKEELDTESGKYRFPTYVGLETDYSEDGVITPQDIETVFREAMETS
jgi:hypothetical protein